MHHTINVLNATELYTLKWLIINFMLCEFYHNKKKGGGPSGKTSKKERSRPWGPGPPETLRLPPSLLGPVLPSLSPTGLPGPRGAVPRLPRAQAKISEVSLASFSRIPSLNNRKSFVSTS